jgi:hypothetical protein
MKQLLLFVWMMLAGSVVANAECDTNQTIQKPAPADGPAMTFEATTIDYGTIDQGSNPIREFKFTNMGTEPLLITSAVGSCGCTVPTFSREPIKPGESSVISVRYDTQRIGPINKTVTLTTNEKQSTHQLAIIGEVKAPATAVGVKN